SAWFARDDDVKATRAQRVGECIHLRRLADPFPTLEADELPARRHAIPNSDLRPIQMRPKKPALPTSSPATSGTTCGGVWPVVRPSAPGTTPRMGLRLPWVMSWPAPIVLPQVKLGSE